MRAARGGRRHPSNNVGDLLAQLRAVLEALTAEGMYTTNKRLPQPSDFVRVALICPATSAVALAAVDEAGVTGRAGLRTGDVPPVLSHTDLFRRLHRHRGRQVELAVVDGGPGPPFRERPRRVLVFVVPPRRGRR